MTLATRPSLPRGFTLIEILVVMTIVALMLSLALPRYTASLERAKEVALQENLKVLRSSLDRFYGDKGRYPERLEELVEQKYLRAVPADPISESVATWILVPSDNAEIKGIVDVKSGAPGTLRDGRRYDSL